MKRYSYKYVLLPGILGLLIFTSNIRVAGGNTILPFKAVNSADSLSAYLMAFFKDDSHALYFAVSSDGYTFTAVHDGNPVISPDSIAEQKGIRDPYIMRGPDGAFYLTMTDLHIFAKDKGLRTTQWQRDDAYGWGNNRAIIIMRSTDLIHWTHQQIRVDTAFPGWEDIGCAWAPELIYDEDRRQMMVYLTIRFKNGKNQLYYSYLNQDLSALATAPKLLFEYPKDNVSYIDADITRVDGRYHMFYTPHDGTPGIKQAVSDHISSGYVYDQTWYDPEPKACEAPHIWKRLGEDKWVLMYDIYGIKPHNFGFSETSDFKTFTDIGHFNNGVMKAANFVSPKHGSVVHISKQELDRLIRYWDEERPQEMVSADKKNLSIPVGYANNLKWDLPLDTIGTQGSKIQWISEQPDYLAHTGKLLKQPPVGSKKHQVKLTAILTAGGIQQQKSFNIYIAPVDPVYDAYLFAYFEGAAGDRKQQEQVRFATSTDAQNWTARNGNRPILDSDIISQTGGIRDPHILRAEAKNTYYMVMTDMSTATNGWGPNPGISLLSSSNLTDWKHSIIDLAKQYPEQFGNVHWVWAPQTVYDPAVNKYLVYFTIRFKDDDKLDFYGAYANADFTAFEDVPKLLFSPRYGGIDGDIIYKDGTYHFFFKGNTKDSNGKEFKNGIKQAKSSSLQGPWSELDGYLDVYHDSRTNVEGSSIFKLNDSDTYILMYDLYSSGRYEFQRSTDLYEFTNKPESFHKDFHPRHGSVISITKKELNKLIKKYK